jgi:hypothetical protein
MLIIRKEQMRAMALQSLEEFESRLTAYITEDFPEQAEALGTANLRKAVHDGVNKALDYSFETERDLSKYVYIMFTLGRDFDKDPEFPWAGEILRADSGSPLRMERLYDAARQFEHIACGLTGGAGSGKTA